MHEVIAEFDRGYDTLVGEGALPFPAVEATDYAGRCCRQPIWKSLTIPLSAVDTQTDAKIRGFKDTCGDQTTTLIITQRVASTRWTRI